MKLVMVLLSYFQDFDHGKVGLASCDHELEVGDTVEWECGQFWGVASVVGREGPHYKVMKKS